MDSQSIATMEGKVNSLLKENTCLKNVSNRKDVVIKQLKNLVKNLESKGSDKEFTNGLVAGIYERNCVIARQQEELYQEKYRSIALEKEIRQYTVVCNRLRNFTNSLIG